MAMKELGAFENVIHFFSFILYDSLTASLQKYNFVMTPTV